MIEIIPTILTKDPKELQEKINLIEGVVPKVQIDVIDGIFVSNKTANLEFLKDFDHNLRIDIHLMVKEPVDWVGRCREALAERVVAQVEMMKDIDNFLAEVATSGMEVGLALDLETPVEKVLPEIYPKLDQVLLMAVKAGFSGQEFDGNVLEKIKKIKKITGDLVDISIDGGLNEENIVKCKQAGANIFYVGKTFWEYPDLEKRYQELMALIK